MTLKKIAGNTIILIITFVILFHWVYLPWNLTWGATEEEINRRLPGQEMKL